MFVVAYLPDSVFPQIGVQSVYEDVARDTNRGHTVQATCESFHLAKDAGFKVVSHMMVRIFPYLSRSTFLSLLYSS